MHSTAFRRLAGKTQVVVFPTDHQRTRLTQAFTAREEHVEVEVAWLCAQEVRSVYHQDTPAAGKAIAEKILNSFTSCPIPEVARLGRTLTH